MFLPLWAGRPCSKWAKPPNESFYSFGAHVSTGQNAKPCLQLPLRESIERETYNCWVRACFQAIMIKVKKQVLEMAAASLPFHQLRSQTFPRRNKMAHRWTRTRPALLWGEEGGKEPFPCCSSDARESRAGSAQKRRSGSTHVQRHVLTSTRRLL